MIQKKDAKVVEDNVNDVKEHIKKIVEKIKMLEQKIEFFFVHIDRVHETNIDLAMQYINSLSANEKKIELI